MSKVLTSKSYPVLYFYPKYYPCVTNCYSRSYFFIRIRNVIHVDIFYPKYYSLPYFYPKYFSRFPRSNQYFYSKFYQRRNFLYNALFTLYHVLCTSIFCIRNIVHAFLRFIQINICIRNVFVAYIFHPKYCPRWYFYYFLSEVLTTLYLGIYKSISGSEILSTTLFFVPNVTHPKGFLQMLSRSIVVIPCVIRGNTSCHKCYTHQYLLLEILSLSLLIVPRAMLPDIS